MYALFIFHKSRGIISTDVIPFKHLANANFAFMSCRHNPFIYKARLTEYSQFSINHLNLYSQTHTIK